MEKGEEFSGAPDPGSENQNISLLKENLKPLTTPFNLFVLFLFNFFASACYSFVGAIVILKYFSWGFSLIDGVNAGLIILTVGNFTQAIVAIYGDSVVTKYGRRKTFVIAGMIIRFIAMLFISAPPVKHTNLMFTWYAVFGSLHQIGYGIYTNPFSSWMIESTVDEADYMKFNIVSGFIAGALGGIISAVTLSISPLGTAVVIAIGGMISLVIIVAYVPTTVYRQAPSVPRPIPSLRICIQSKEFRTILWLTIIIGAASSMYGQLVLFIFATCFGLNNESFVIQLALASAVIGTIIGILVIISCNWIFKKIEKIRVFVFLLFILISLSIATFFLTLNRSTLYPYLIGTIIMTIIATPGSFILNLLLRDLVIFDTFVTRFNRENMFLTAQGIPSNILSSFIASIPIVILTLSGFKAKTADDDHIRNLYSWDSGSLWIMRISSSFVVAALGIVAFLLIRNYPLTQKVTDKINEVVKNRELMRETGDLELRDDAISQPTAAKLPSDSTISDTTSSSFMVDLEDEVKLTNDERETLLHLSAAELYRVYAAIDSQVYSPEQGVLLIKTLLKYGFSYAIFTIVIMIIALVFNTIYLNGLFSTIIIYFVLLVAFYAFYEFFRYTTVRQLLNWNPKDLKAKAQKVYKEFTKKGDNLAVMLAREGIHIDSVMAEDAQESQFMSEFGVAPKSIIANDLKEEDIAEEAFVGLSGYKRIFASLTVLSVLSLVVIIASVA